MSPVRDRREAWLLASASTVILVLSARSIAASLMLLLPLVLAPALVPWRLQLGPWAELLGSVLLAGLAIVLAERLPPADYGGLMGPLVPQIMLVVLFLMLGRAWFRHPYRGASATLALGLFGATAAGGAPLGWTYPALCALYLGLALLALREADPVRASVSGWQQWPSGMLTLALGALFAGGLALCLPPLYERASERLVGMLLDDVPRIRFTEGPMRLGGLESVWQSDRVVLRLNGAPGTPHLRGSVHRRYQDGRWELAPRQAVRTLAVASGADGVEVELLDEANGPLFLPLGAVALAGEGLSQDAFGIVRALVAPAPRRYHYQPAGVLPLPPDSQDLLVPEALRPALSGLAESWLAGVESSPRARLDALQRRLERDYVYSLRYQRRPDRDPVLDFLTGPVGQGHCEYFASALALLARSAGLPARVVRGYRPTERNPWLGHLLVRESSAHAWVEVWIDGAWITRDPAPQRSVAPAPPTRSAWFSAALDTAGYALRRLARLLWRAEAALLLIGLGAFLLLWPRLRRWWRGRQWGRGGLTRVAPAPPLFHRLLNLLRPHRPAPGETLDQFADRLGEILSPAQAAEAHHLLRRYGALRYGGVGSESELGAAIDECQRRWRAAGQRAASP